MSMGATAPTRGRSKKEATDVSTEERNQSRNPHTRQRSFGGAIPSITNRITGHSMQQMELMNRSSSMMKFGRLSSKQLMKEKARIMMQFGDAKESKQIQAKF